VQGTTHLPNTTQGWTTQTLESQRLASLLLVPHDRLLHMWWPLPPLLLLLLLLLMLLLLFLHLLPLLLLCLPPGSTRLGQLRP
jgi:hypothetical protein